jgi:hypothetical protein
LYFLLSILNSNVIDWYYKQISAQLGNTAVRLFSIYVNILPIPLLSSEAEQPFINLVDEIMEKKKQGENSEKEEQEIDKMVYKLYELTYEEIKIVEGNK